MSDQLSKLQRAADRLSQFHLSRIGYDNPRLLIQSLQLLCQHQAIVQFNIIGRMECALCCEGLEEGSMLQCGDWVHPKCLEEQAMALSPIFEANALAPLRCPSCERFISYATLAGVITKERINEVREQATMKVVKQMEQQQRQKRQREVDNLKFKCQKCKNEWKINDMITLSCEKYHRFCKQCLLKHVTERIKSGKFAINDICCPTCGEDINDQVLESVMKPQEFERLIGMRNRYMKEQRDIQYPRYWVNNREEMTLYPVDPKSEEFTRIQTQFKIFPIKALRRVQNLIIWRKYIRERLDLERITGGAIQERYLFHGTRANDPRSIYEDKDEAFNINYSSDGNSYGRGIYFAMNSSYSDGYKFVQGALRTMLYCRVLVGTSQQANLRAGMKDTDYKDEAKRIRYDSVFNGSIYVIYKSRRAYPEYIIDY